MEKYLIAGLIVYILNCAYWIAFASRNIKRINKMLEQLNYTSKIQKLNNQEQENLSQVVKIKQQADTSAAIRAASKIEHIEMHNADNLGDDVIIDANS